MSEGYTPMTDEAMAAVKAVYPDAYIAGDYAIAPGKDRFDVIRRSNGQFLTNPCQGARTPAQAWADAASRTLARNLHSLIPTWMHTWMQGHFPLCEHGAFSEI